MTTSAGPPQLTSDPTLKSTVESVAIPDPQFMFGAGESLKKQSVRDVEYAIYRPQENGPHKVNGQDTITIRVAKNSQHVLLHKGFFRFRLNFVNNQPGDLGTHHAAVVIPGGNQGIIGNIDMQVDSHQVKDSKSDQNILHAIRRLTTARQSNERYLQDTNFYKNGLYDSQQPGFGAGVLQGNPGYKAAADNLFDYTANLDAAQGSRGAMITVYLHDCVDMYRYHKKVNFGSDLYIKITLIKLAELYIEQYSTTLDLEANPLITAANITEFEFWVPTVEPTKDQRALMIRTLENLSRVPHPIEYLHEEIYSKNIITGCSTAKKLYTIPNNRVRYLVIALQECAVRDTFTIDSMLFPGKFTGNVGIKNLQVNYNGKSILRQRYELDFVGWTKGWRAYDDFRRFAGKAGSGNILVNYHDWRTKYAIFALDLYELGTGGRFKVNNTSNQFELEIEFTAALQAPVEAYLTAYSEMTKELLFASDHMRLRNGTSDSS